MKKLTVMAACAALLLGGGCFLKANQMNNELLSENLVAFSENVYEAPYGYSGTCCVKYHDGSDIMIRCGISKNEVNFWGGGSIINWCCDSCPSASYSYE